MGSDTTIIIPCYNEALRFDTDLFDQYYTALPGAYFVFVNDGSSDHTRKLLHDIAFAKANIHILSLTYNVGKGEAIRQGMLWALAHTKASFFAYFDADFATPLTEVLSLQRSLKQQSEAFLVLGSRQVQKGTTIKRYWYRHIPGRVFAKLINWLVLKHPVYDTQCGAKVMTRSCTERFFKDTFQTRWLFDIELIQRISYQSSKKELKKRILEIPVSQWTDFGGSKIRFSDAVMIPFQLVRLVFK